MGAYNRTGTTGSVKWLALVCGVAVATGTQLVDPPAGLASPDTDWGSQAAGPIAEINKGMSRLYSELNLDNVNGGKALCRQLQASGQTLRSMLPAPNQVLTAEVSRAVTPLLAGTKRCLAVGTEADRAEVNSVRRLFETAMVHLNNADTLIGDG
jgi:hypothetical protein